MPQPGVYYAVGDPMVLGVKTYPELVDVYKSVQDSVRDILTTQVGTRRMRPAYGCNIYSFLFETNSDALVARAQIEVRRALELNEPRIIVERVRVGITKDAAGEPTVIQLDVEYSINREYLTQTITFKREGG